MMNPMAGQKYKQKRLSNLLVEETAQLQRGRACESERERVKKETVYRKMLSAQPTLT